MLFISIVRVEVEWGPSMSLVPAMEEQFPTLVQSMALSTASTPLLWALCPSVGGSRFMINIARGSWSLLLLTSPLELL